jgi:hypothetical protein
MRAIVLALAEMHARALLEADPMLLPLDLSLTELAAHG